MFSATLPDGIIKLSGKYLNNPERVSMGATNTIAKNIQQEVIRLDQGEKYSELLKQLQARQGTAIIFVKTKHGTEKMAKKLCRSGVDADALHGGLRQNKRTSVMNNFRQKKFRVLVATDIAARGLDVPHISHVINYDLPQVAEDYIHRMGRTARAGAQGSALCFVSPQDGIKWRAIEKLLDPSKKYDPLDSETVSDGTPRKNRRRRPHSRRHASGNKGHSSGGGRGNASSKPRRRRFRSNDTRRAA